MQYGDTIQELKNQLASVLMTVLLVWLTVSTPFIYEQQQKNKQLMEQQTGFASSEENDVLPNTTEEKTESGVNTLSEYLHEPHVLQQHFIAVASYFKCHPSDLYFAFHPELVLPPPKA